MVIAASASGSQPSLTNRGEMAGTKESAGREQVPAGAFNQPIRAAQWWCGASPGMTLNRWLAIASVPPMLASSRKNAAML